MFQTEVVIAGEPMATVPITGEARAPVQLHVRVLGPNGQVTPARVYLHGSDGRSHIPSRGFDRIMWMTGEHYFYTSGEFNAVLPGGRTEIEIRKGFDYKPISQTFQLHPNKPARLDLKLEWLRDMNAEGWYGGDDHIHGNYTGEQWSTPVTDQLVVAAEGLNVANLLVSNSSGDVIHDEQFFEGKVNALSTASELMYWNQEMRTWSYGHLLLLNLKQLVRPLYTGFPAANYWEDFPSNYEKAQQAREYGGIALYAHPALAFDSVPSGSLAGESVADVPLGAIDAFEVFCSHDEPSMELWYRFLNLGFKLPISGGSDAFLNQSFSFLAGGERVYVHTGDRFTYRDWIEELRRGRSFATVGPLLTFEVNKQIPGAELHFASVSASVSVHVNAASAIPFTSIELVANGRVVASAARAVPTHRIEWRGKIPVESSEWLAVRVWGPNNHRISNGPSRWSQRRS
jgi:hypothetical protein